MPDDTLENNQLARKAFESVYTMMPYSETDFAKVKNQTKRGSVYLDNIYDGMLLYAQVLNETLHNTENKTVHGSNIYNNLRGKTFKGGSHD